MDLSSAASNHRPERGRYSHLMNSSNIDLWAWSFLGMVFLLRILYASFLGLIPDETYYWDWSRQLSFGYFDHPPMVAWLIFASRQLFGETALGVRFAIIACSFAASLSSYMLLKKYVSKPSSLFLFVVLSSSILLFGVGTLLATPDVPLVLFWSCSLLFGYKAIFENSTPSWLILGLCAGCGLLSKYTFVLFFAAFILFVFFSRSRRFWLLRWQPYASLLLSMLIWLPNLVWNAHHGWVSFAFQFSHGISGNGSLRFNSLGEFLAGQVGILSVFPFVLLLCALAVSWKSMMKNSRNAYLAMFFYVPFLVFLFASMQKKVEANWAATAYVSGLILIALYWDNLDRVRNKGMRRFAVFAVVFAALTTTAVLFHLQKPFLPLAPANDPATQVRGWKEWAHDLNGIRNSIDPAGSLTICTNRYQEASMLGYYLPDHPKTFALCLGARENNYNLFSERKPRAFQKIIFIHPAVDVINRPLYSDIFSSIEKRGAATLRQGPRCANTFNVYVAILRKSL
jgi:4-amino-4-deoxy-L-arabinose transferase-like glycosyltransferase